MDVEVLIGTHLFNLAQREADVAFRIVPFDITDLVQPKVFRLECGVYIAEAAPEPRFRDSAGFHYTSTGHFPDIAWLIDNFPNAKSVLRSNNRHV